MRKKGIYILGLLALGFVVFNNVIQTTEVISQNPNYLIGLILALIGTIVYGMVNIKD